MDDVLSILGAALAAARDWLTLFAACAGAGYAWSVHRLQRRRAAVFIDGRAERVSNKTLRIRLRVRNHTLRDVRLARITVRRPRQAVVAMDGVHPPGEGPIECNHIVPALAAGEVVFLLGSPQVGNGPVCLRLTYVSPATWSWARYGKRLRIDPAAVVLADPAADGGDGTEAGRAA